MYGKQGLEYWYKRRWENLLLEAVVRMLDNPGKVIFL